MADPVTLRNARDSYVAQLHPDKNFNSKARLYIAAAGAGNQRFAYMYFSKPYPAGATILNATLRLYNGDPWTGSINLTVERVSSKWGGNTITYNNRPGVFGGSAVVVNKSSPAAKTLWEFNVTNMIQTVANGGAWYGFKISVGGTDPKWLFSAQSDSDYRPTLEITWSDAPDAPEDLAPDGNRGVSTDKPILTFDYTDVSGDTDLAAAQVQINSTDVWTSPSFDSGEVATSVPEIDLAATAYAGLANGASTFWRVRVKDGAGIWSTWSDAAQFKRTDKGTLTLNNPAASPNNHIEDPTPPINWSLSGATQRAYQVILTTPDSPEDWIWTSGKVTSTDTTITLPPRKIRKIIDTYRLILRVWDTADRERVPGHPAWYSVTRDFTYKYDATVNPVTGLSGVQDFPWPWMHLDFSRSSAPDSFTILRDDEVVETDVVPNDIFVSGTSYRYTDRTVSPRVDHDWKVLAIVNGKTSQSNPTWTGKTQPQTTWLMRPDGTDPVFLMNPNIDPEMASFQEMHEPLSGAPILITQSIRGYEGRVEGIFTDGIVAGLSARLMRNRLKQFKRRPGQKLILFMVDETLEVVIYNVTYRPEAKSGGQVIYRVRFNFFETDF